MNTNTFTSRLVWPALAAILCLAPAAQADQVGKILFATEGVRIVDVNGDEKPAKRGDPVHAGERIVTGPGELAQVKMTDGGFVGVRSDSSLAFERQATAIAGAPHVLKLDRGDVRVLNMSFDDRTTPKEFVLKIPDGLVQLMQADSVASLRPAGDGPGTSKQTLVRLSAGGAVASNIAGAAKPVAVNEIVSVTPTEVKPIAVRMLAAPPRISSRLQTAQDPLSRTVAGTTPIDTSTGPRLPSLEDLPSPGLAAARSGASDTGLDVQPSLTKVAPTSPRVEEKFVNPVANQPIKPSVSTAAVVAVKTRTLPSLIVPPTVKPPAPTATTSLRTKVFTGKTTVVDPTTIKSFKSVSGSGLSVR